MTSGKVTGIIANLVTIECDGPVGQNEICYIQHGNSRLMAEVIRVNGNVAQAQVFESTRGVRPGIDVEFTGHMLEIDLGPGILSRKYDGLQMDLEKVDGVFLKRGFVADSLDPESSWDFKPIAKAGDTVKAADWLGRGTENWI
ncbi:MAG TPA: V-type ATP synthase subunit A, partial [Leptospiraceae bacterium]|nr:V-type ATP synthase subunit A [Leptospiraceae bacterium]